MPRSKDLNLIICTTPLQVLIAERIIDLYADEDFYGVFFTNKPNDKVRLYAQRLIDKCGRGKLVHSFETYPIEPGFFGSWRRAWGFVCNMAHMASLPRFKRIFMGCLSHFTANYFFMGQNRAELVTFDDGTANVDLKSWEQVATWGMNPWLIQLNRISARLGYAIPTFHDLVKRKARHYSIYKLPNFLDPSTYIPLFEPHTGVASMASPTRKVSIFIAQDLYHYEPAPKERSVALLRRCCSDFGVQYLYPHPFWTVPVEGVETIHSPLCFEDYILQRIVAEPDTHFTLYSFCSSALLNLALVQLPNLTLVALHPEDTPSYIEGAYEAFRASGLRLVEVEGITS